MNSSSLYRRAPGLLAGAALLLSCFLFSGCKISHVLGPFILQDLFGEYQDQFPTVVLSVDEPGPVNYTFDWKTTTIGGIMAANFIPSTDFWRMNVFSFSDGNPKSSYKFKSIEQYPTESFTNLDAEKLLRVDLDLADNEEGTKNRKSYSFTVLFHYEEPVKE